MRRTILAVLAVALLGAAPAPQPKAAAKAAPVAQPALPALVFAIGTPNGEEAAIKAKELIEKHLTRALSSPVRVRIIPDATDLAEALPKGEADAAWMTPTVYARASTYSKDVRPVVKAKRNGKLSYRTAYIVKADSPVKNLPELAGKKVAWVSPSSASGYLFARALLSWAGRDPDRFFGSEMFAGTHPGVCKAVRSGEADVGATLADPPLPGKPFEADGCADSPPVSDFRVIAASEPIPNDVVATGPRMSPKVAAAFNEVFQKMGDSPEGRALMKDAFRVEAWAPVGEKDFETVLKVLELKNQPAAAAEVKAEPKAADAKAETKPADAKVEPKKTEPKPADSKVEAKTEAKAETKAADAKVEPKKTEPKPADSKVEAKTEAKAADAKVEPKKTEPKPADGKAEPKKVEAKTAK